jgi:hypothetical protein
LEDELLRLFNVTSCVVRCINKELVEEVSSPFNAMLNLIREISESAHGNRFFRRVL